jgi:hypothetical protein
MWGVLSGAFHNADEASKRFYETEMESDGNHTKATDERRRHPPA